MSVKTNDRFIVSLKFCPVIVRGATPSIPQSPVLGYTSNLHPEIDVTVTSGGWTSYKKVLSNTKLLESRTVTRSGGAEEVSGGRQLLKSNVVRFRVAGVVAAHMDSPSIAVSAVIPCTIMPFKDRDKEMCW